MPTTISHSRRLIRAFNQPDAVDFYFKVNEQQFFPSEKAAFEKYLKPGMCLDIGCKSGRVALPLAKAGFDVVGIDFVQEAVFCAKKEAQRQGLKAKFCVGYAPHLMFKDRTFDHVILANGVIQIFSKEERLTLLKEIKRVLKNDGVCVIHTNNGSQHFPFPYSCEAFLQGIRHLKRKFFDSPRSFLRHSFMAKKLSEPHLENLLMLTLDTLSTLLPSIVVDTKRRWMQRILAARYRGPKPYERFITKRFFVESFRSLPFYLYRKKELWQEMNQCGLSVLDYQADWELIFKQRLPGFLKSYAPITYYCVQNISPDAPVALERINDIIPLLKSGLSKREYMIFQIVTPSMKPILCPGDKLYAKKVDPSSLRPGDIVIFEYSGHLISHRMIGFKDHQTLITKGDNSATVDPFIAASAVIAVVFRVDKEKGRILLHSFWWKKTSFLLALISRWEARYAHKKSTRTFLVIIKSLFFIFNPALLLLLCRKRSNLSLQQEIIVQLCEDEGPQKDPGAINLLLKECRRWESFLPLAFYNNIGPLLYKNLSGVDTRLLPFWIVDALKKDYEQNTSKTNTAYRDLAKLLQEFKNNHVDVIVLKGAALAEKLYRDTGLRPMEDIDILVKKTDWPAIRTILHKAEFYNKEGLDLLQLEEMSDIAMNRHVSYENSGGTKIEFKFHLFILDFPRFSDEGQYWQKAMEIKLAGAQTLTLSLEDQFLYLASRMVNVGLRHFLWFYDLKRFLFLSPHLRWDDIVDKAINSKTATILYYVLRALKEKFLTDSIPEEVLRKLQPPTLRRALLDFLFGYNAMGFRKPHDRHWLTTMLMKSYVFLSKFGLTAGGLIKITGYLFRILFPSTRYLCYRYGITPRQALWGKGLLLRLKRVVPNGR